MHRSDLYKSIAQRLGFIAVEKHENAKPSDIPMILKQAKKKHEDAKRVAEAKSKSKDRATQGGAAGMAHSMYDYFDYVLRTDLYELTGKRDPEIRKAAKDAYKQVEAMRDWWYAQWEKWSASRSSATKMARETVGVGDWVEVLDGVNMVAYGPITRISGNKVTVSSAEGKVETTLANVHLVRKGSPSQLRTAGFGK